MLNKAAGGFSTTGTGCDDLRRCLATCINIVCYIRVDMMMRSLYNTDEQKNKIKVKQGNFHYDQLYKMWILSIL